MAKPKTRKTAVREINKTRKNAESLFEILAAKKKGDQVFEAELEKWGKRFLKKRKK